MHWTLCVLIIGSFGCKYIHAQAQRVAPGVPPQHYQQPVQVPQQHAQHIPQQQQYQQAPIQQVPVQQVPMQVQQVPVQQQQVPMQQQIPVQQVPMQQASMHQQSQGQQGHGHVHSHGQPQIFNTDLAHEKEHIAEHADIPIDTNKMTEQELQFHYFKMHDADNNNKLDGCELIKSLIHWHEQGNTEGTQGTQGNKLFKDEELVQLIDPILSMDDSNNDGYIDYPEFIQAQQNAAATNTRP